MPTLVVTETWVYSLTELKERGGDPYQKALEAIKESVNSDGFYWQWMKEDMQQWFDAGPNGGYLGGDDAMDYPFDGGEVGECGTYPTVANFEYEIELMAYMRRKKIANKLRSLYTFMLQEYKAHGWGCDASGKAGSNYSNRRGDQFLPADIAEGLCSDIDALERENPARAAKINAQLDDLMGYIAQDCEAVTKRLKRWVDVEEDYRYSDEFAHEEAEALEIGFYQSGKIYGFGVAFDLASTEVAAPAEQAAA